jgi:PQQ-dependent dehydrogenase (methanol/ethanol family)
MRVVIAIGTGLLLIVGAWLLNQELSNNDTEVKSGQTSVDSTAWITEATETLDGKRIIKADNEPENWLAHGRTYDEQRFSPLDQITADNVSDLGLAWYFDTGTDRGLEASPIVVDGVMYTSGSWSVVFANDARTGELIWQFDPEVPKEWGVNACCDVVNRGVAVWKGRVYVGTIDGRLIALDAATGEVNWDVSTIDKTKPYTITGAPRIINDKVIIGNGGAEYGVRGYVTAYDTATGEQAWRFYTVPGNPDKPFESPAMEDAAKTWTGRWWTMGGGGTVWDSMAFDSELNYLYLEWVTVHLGIRMSEARVAETTSSCPLSLR